MKFVYPEIDKVFDTETDCVQTLVIENQSLLRRVLEDLYAQSCGFHGNAILSIRDQPVEISKYAEVINSFIPFEINRKPLLTKITSALEKEAMAPEHYARSGELLQQVMEYLEAVSFGFPCDITFPKLSISGLIKSAGPELRDDYTDLCEKIFDYMEFVQTFDRDKLFIFVNMRSFVEDSDMQLFMDTVLSHGFHILMLESCAYPVLPRESRWIVDRDLCEIDCKSETDGL